MPPQRRIEPLHEMADFSQPSYLFRRATLLVLGRPITRDDHHYLYIDVFYLRQVHDEIALEFYACRVTQAFRITLDDILNHPPAIDAVANDLHSLKFICYPFGATMINRI